MPIVTRFNILVCVALHSNALLVHWLCAVLRSSVAEWYMVVIAHWSELWNVLPCSTPCLECVWFVRIRIIFPVA